MFQDLSKYHFNGYRYSSAAVAAIIRRQSGYKRCGHCEYTKPLCQFHQDQSRSDGLYPWCLSCAAEHRDSRRERRLATDKARRARLTERQREMVPVCSADLPEDQRLTTAGLH